MTFLKDLKAFKYIPSKYYRRGTAFTYVGVLEAATHALSMVRQWSESGYFDTAAEYMHKAEALIELLEVHNCGSTGGFDKGQGDPRTLITRWQWLVDHKPKE